jgi:F1F0 ATPase subunit 2
MYREAAALALACAAGLALGAFYFGTLWLTVQKAQSMRRPALLFFAGGFARVAVVVVSFYFIMDGKWQRLLACLAGFIVMRVILVKRLRPERTQA